MSEWGRIVREVADAIATTIETYCYRFDDAVECVTTLMNEDPLELAVMLSKKRYPWSRVEEEHVRIIENMPTPVYRELEQELRRRLTSLLMEMI